MCTNVGGGAATNAGGGNQNTAPSASMNTSAVLRQIESTPFKNAGFGTYTLDLPNGMGAQILNETSGSAGNCKK